MTSTDQPAPLAGRVAIVTGSGSGLGRAEALELARSGASVVVNDVDPDAAHATADDIKGLGVDVAVVVGDVGERTVADAMLAAAVDDLGGLHVVVNNAGFTRDRMLFNMSDEEWDAVVRVHLRGHFLLTRNAAAHWRAQVKASGEPAYARVVNTASEAALVGSEGQPNYSAAKAGIAALTVSTARSLARLGVRANAICPRARTAMTQGVFGAHEGGAPDPLSVDHVAPLVAYLASPAAERITGQVFVVHGRMVALMAAPAVAQRFDRPDTSTVWTHDQLDAQLAPFFAERDPQLGFAATDVLGMA